MHKKKKGRKSVIFLTILIKQKKTGPDEQKRQALNCEHTLGNQEIALLSK